MAILDTDFLSSFFKVGKIKLILKALQIEHIVVPSTVYDELKEAQFFNEIASLFVFDKNELNKEKFILVKAIEGEANFTKEEMNNLGKGEIGCFILAKNINDTILIDDQKARIIAKKKGLKVVSISTFLLFCKKKKILSSENIREIVAELKEKDYYEFSDDVKQTLYNE